MCGLGLVWLGARLLSRQVPQLNLGPAAAIPKEAKALIRAGGASRRARARIENCPQEVSGHVNGTRSFTYLCTKLNAFEQVSN